MRKFAILSLLLLLVGGVGKFWHFLKDGFNIRRIGYALPAIGVEEGFSEEGLSGPFYYLGRGRQCYAFESPDRKYVLKIPRFDCYELPFIWKAPFPFLAEMRKSLEGVKRNRKVFLLKSFTIAAADLKEDTALLYLHLHDTGSLLGCTALIDRLGRRYEIDLNRIAFVLQEKMPLMAPQFLEAVKRNDDETTTLILDAFLGMLKNRARLGIFNKDPTFIKNIGWKKGRIAQIDIGSFYRKEDLSEDTAYRACLKNNSDPIREWLRGLNPDLPSRFDKEMEKACADSY